MNNPVKIFVVAFSLAGAFAFGLVQIVTRGTGMPENELLFWAIATASALIAILTYIMRIGRKDEYLNFLSLNNSRDASLLTMGVLIVIGIFQLIDLLPFFSVIFVPPIFGLCVGLVGMYRALRGSRMQG